MMDTNEHAKIKSSLSLASHNIIIRASHIEMLMVACSVSQSMFSSPFLPLSRTYNTTSSITHGQTRSRNNTVSLL